MSDETQAGARSGEEYYGIVREKKSWVKPMAIAVGLFMMYFSFSSKMYLGLPLGLLIVLAAFFRKELAVYDKGVELRYFMRVADHVDLWPWADITTLHREDQGNEKIVAMHFGKGPLTRTFFMTRSDASKVMALARRKNPSMQVSDMPSEEPGPKPAPRRKR